MLTLPLVAVVLLRVRWVSDVPEGESLSSSAAISLGGRPFSPYQVCSNLVGASLASHPAQMAPEKAAGSRRPMLPIVVHELLAAGSPALGSDTSCSSHR